MAVMRATNTKADADELTRQLEEAVRIREFAGSIVEGRHDGNFERKDYIAFALFNRCLQSHEAIQLLVRQSLIDDVWILVRSLVEHAVNAVYMLNVADGATADDFNDFQNYLGYKALLDLKATDGAMLRHLVSEAEEEKGRLRFEAIRDRFDNRRGDKWCVDDRLYKRAARVDAGISAATRDERSDFLWLVNSAWRHGSVYTHGMAGALFDQVQEKDDAVIFHRTYTYDEAAKALLVANFALYLVSLPVDVRLGGKNGAELNRRMGRLVPGRIAPSTDGEVRR
jgi:hypothetical protein